MIFRRRRRKKRRIKAQCRSRFKRERMRFGAMEKKRKRASPNYEGIFRGVDLIVSSQSPPQEHIRSSSGVVGYSTNFSINYCETCEEDRRPRIVFHTFRDLKG
jgi:hypothetical protein